MSPVTVVRGTSPIVLAQPHSGTFVPADIGAKLTERGAMLADTDWHIPRLYDGLVPQATVVRAEFNRYVIDANRPPDGASLYPGQNTTGLVPLVDFENRPLWHEEPDENEIARRREAFHAPYHAALRAELDRVRAAHGFAVLYDQRDPDPQRRYKGFYWEHGGTDTFVEHEGRLIWGQGEGDGMWMSFSPDGIRWDNCVENPVIPLGSDTTQSLVWDETIASYVAFGRMGANGRRVARATSRDAVHFDEPTMVFDTDQWDEEGTQFYGMPLSLYEGMYLGMVWVYREGVDGRIDTSLACSRDGIDWQRVGDRETFLGLGERGSWEDGMVRISQHFVVVDDEIYLYYGGVEGPHTGRKFAQVKRTHAPAIGLATLRRDGFVSLEANDQPGAMLTKPIVVTGDHLHVNAASHGHLIAEVTDDTGAVLPGYTSLPMVKDRTDAALRFDRPLAALQGHTVRLRFHLKRANLFSYWFT